jgi:hypothetical protein
VGYTGSQGIPGEAAAIGYTGSQGDAGFTGSAGQDGVVGRDGYDGSQGDIGYTGSAGSNGYAGSQGTTGFTGSKGDTGSSVQIAGSASSVSTLPALYEGNIGDGYLTQDDGHLHVWMGSLWLDVGQIQGPRGYTGSAGAGGDGSVPAGNYDGGTPDSNHVGITALDAGYIV